MDVMINGRRFVAERPDKTKKTPFYELIKSAREQNMESLETAAKSIGTTKSNLWNLEQGTSMPGLPMLQRILKHYDIKFDEIESCVTGVVKKE